MLFTIWAITTTLCLIVIIVTSAWEYGYKKHYIPRYGQHPLGWVVWRRWTRHPVVKELRRPIALKKLPPPHERLLEYVCPKCGKPLAHRRYSISKDHPTWGDIQCAACGFKQDIDYRQVCNGGTQTSTFLQAYCLSTYEKSIVEEAERRLMADWDKRFADGEALPEIHLPRNYARDRRTYV